MDFARVLALVDGCFSRVGRPYAVIGALGMAGVNRQEVLSYFAKYGLEELIDRLQF